MAALALAASCGSGRVATDHDAAHAPAAARPEIVGPIVATVNGEPIGLDEVRATAESTGLAPLDALHRLEQERVLLAHVGEAQSDAEVESATRRAAVQALLRAQIEAQVGPASVDDAEVAARYAAQRASWARPERRESVHVLATPTTPTDEAARAAAERFVRAAIARLIAASDPVREAQAIGAEDTSGRSYTVRVEPVPAVARHDALAEPYLAALFALPTAPAVTPEPVSTSFGVHAIVLTSIAPAFEVPLEEASPVLRRQLLAEHRAVALDAYCADLRARTHVAIDERVAATVFTSTSFASTAGAAP
jgi:hypothetical protein